jgi:hypothetical protein
MEHEFSTLKKTKILIIVAVVYGLIFFVTSIAEIYFRASVETKNTTTFFFAVYAIMLIAIATVVFKSPLSLKIFQIILYVGLGIIFSGLLNLTSFFFYNLSLYNVNGWASLIGGLYLLFIWLLGQGGLDKK